MWKLQRHPVNFGNDDNWFILALKQFNLNVNSFSDALQTGSIQTGPDGKTSFRVFIEPKDHSSLVPFLSNFECFIKLILLQMEWLKFITNLLGTSHYNIVWIIQILNIAYHQTLVSVISTILVEGTIYIVETKEFY